MTIQRTLDSTMAPGTALAVAMLLSLAAGSASAYQELKTSKPGDTESAQAQPEQLAALSEPKAPAAKGNPTAAPVYVPPRRGAPATRVGGGTRSGGTGVPQIALLSPEHTGLTHQASPTLYWYLSSAYTGTLELVVTGRDSVTPELRLRLEDAQPAGIHALDLAEHGLVLAPGRLYQWSVSIVRDEEHRSRDVVSVATIERLASDSAHQSGGAVDLAAAGLWYDAVDAASRTGTRATRAALLEQVGLDAAAAWDRDF